MIVIIINKDIHQAVSGINRSAAQSSWESVDGKGDPVGDQDWPERARGMEREEGLGQSLKKCQHRKGGQTYEKTKKK